MAATARMTPDGAREAREAIGLTEESLAAELGLTPDVVRAWETGAVQVPERHARLLVWRVAVDQHQRAMATSGLPECSAARTLVTRLNQSRGGAARVQTALQRHHDECPTCQARARFAETLPPLPDFPLAGSLGLLVRVWKQIARLPRWARPAAWGSLLVGGIIVFRVLILLVATGPSWRLLGLAAAGVAVGGYLGVIGGLVYDLVRGPLRRRLGRAGDVLTGLLCAGAYMLAIAVPMALWSGVSMWRDPMAWLIFGALGLFFGGMLAWANPLLHRDG